LSFAEREDELEGDGAGDAQRDVPSRKDGLSDKEDRGQKDADGESSMMYSSLSRSIRPFKRKSESIEACG
jgi:hypothetical protein